MTEQEHVVTTMAEIEALRAQSKAERTPTQEALEVIGEAASALEHQQPLPWSAGGIARLRTAAEVLRDAAQDRELLDTLADMCCDGASGRDVLLRRSINPDRWASNDGVHDVIEIRQWDGAEGFEETVREALQRTIQERAQ